MKAKVIRLIAAVVIISIMFSLASTEYVRSSEFYDKSSELKDDFYEHEIIKAAKVGLIIGKGVKLDEVYDGSIEVVAKREDFDSEENFKTYIEDRGLKYVPSDFDVELSETLYNNDKTNLVNYPSVTVEHVYSSMLSTYKNKAIQAFVVDGSYIYITQRYKEWTFYDTKGNLRSETGNYVLLSRCSIASDNTFTRTDAMLLEDVGHGQTLEKYTYGGTPYLWISCGNNQASGADKCWSVQMGRIEYSGHTMSQLKYHSNVLNNSQIKRLIDLSYSRTGTSSFGTMWRSDSAISTDANSGNYLFIWKQNNLSGNEFSIYNFDTINYELSHSTSNEVSFQGNSTLRNACNTSFSMSGLPDSFQGYDLSKISNGLHSIYLASGNEAKANFGYKNKVFRYNSLGQLKCEGTIDDTGIWWKYTNDLTYNANAEIEGVKIYGSYLQFIIRDNNNPERQVLARAAKSNFQ